MKKFFTLIVITLLCSNILLAQKKAEILTNESIFSLCNSGLSSTVIIAKIKKQNQISKQKPMT